MVNYFVTSASSIGSYICSLARHLAGQMLCRAEVLIQRPVAAGAILVLMTGSASLAQQQFEFCNNWLQNVSFITGTDRGMEQNLEDNFGWMQEQGYTHLRFFGIYPNGYHAFPSPTLDANGFPTNSYFEGILELLVLKANQFSITVNFDGWEVIAESNYDTTELGVSFITEQELGDVVQEVLSLGVTLISEEQFGSGYLQTIQSVASQMGATHETTAGIWWQSAAASTIADAQLASVFSFYPYDQAEADSLINVSSIAANLGVLHLFLEGPRYFGIPYSVAAGSFGTMGTEHWKNALRFVQLQHHPGRFSIEETNWDFLIWDTSFNFMSYIGDELLSLAGQSLPDRPVANLIYDPSSIGSPSFIPAWFASIVSASAIVNTFTSLGYRVVPTLDSVLADADFYYLLLAGGMDSIYVASLPDYVMPLLEASTPVFVHPALGIPDVNDAGDWTPLREFFELPLEDTYTLTNSIPVSVLYDGKSVLWGGVSAHITPRIEIISSQHFDTTESSAVLSGDVSEQNVALIIQNANKFLINSNVIHLQASYILSDLLSGPLNGPSTADIVIADGQALILAEYATDVDIDLPWTGMTQVTRYNSHGNPIVDSAMDLQGGFSATLARGELVILAEVISGCCNGDGLRGNADMVTGAGGEIDVADLTYMVAYLFQAGPAPPCLDEANVDGVIGPGSPLDVLDLTYLVAYLFLAGPEPRPCP